MKILNTFTLHPFLVIITSLTCSDISSLVQKEYDLRQKSTSEEHRPSSPVEVALNDYEVIHGSEYFGTKKCRKLSEIDNPLSASRETASSDHHPKSCFLLLSGKKGLHVISDMVLIS